jgi:hypothetical protein
MSVQRYDMKGKSRGMECWSEMKETPEGEWVEYEDYEKLAVKVLELKEEIRALLAELRYIEGR